MQLDLAVEEIFVNIAEYAYSPEIGSVTISLEIDSENKKISMTLADCGKVYNPLTKSDPNINLLLEEREIGGLGIFIIKKFVDEISYRRDKEKNILHFTKSF